MSGFLESIGIQILEGILGGLVSGIINLGNTTYSGIVNYNQRHTNQQQCCKKRGNNFWKKGMFKNWTKFRFFYKCIF